MFVLSSISDILRRHRKPRAGLRASRGRGVAPLSESLPFLLTNGSNYPAGPRDNPLFHALRLCGGVWSLPDTISCSKSGSEKEEDRLVLGNYGLTTTSRAMNPLLLPV